MIAEATGLHSLLFPYTMTILCFDTGLMSYQPEDLYSVVFENEKTVSPLISVASLGATIVVQAAFGGPAALAVSIGIGADVYKRQA